MNQSAEYYFTDVDFILLDSDFILVLRLLTQKACLYSDDTLSLISGVRGMLHISRLTCKAFELTIIGGDVYKRSKINCHGGRNVEYAYCNDKIHMMSIVRVR